MESGQNLKWSKWKVVNKPIVEIDYWQILTMNYCKMPTIDYMNNDRLLTNDIYWRIADDRYWQTVNLR